VEPTTDLSERLGTLFAARTPGHSALFQAGTTPVNTLATLLNAYVGGRHALASNDSYLVDPGAIVRIGSAASEP
jgi:hypothetical protein